MFCSEEDEYCLRNRGTEYIKSPEMLALTINSKKEGDKYDRRRKVIKCSFKLMYDRLVRIEQVIYGRLVACSMN